LTGSTLTFIIAYAVTGSIAIAGPVAIIQVILNTVAYWVHERVWNKVKWGKIIANG